LLVQDHLLESQNVLLLVFLPPPLIFMFQHLVQDKKSDRINRMNKIILFFIMVNPKFTIS
jgi:hypothetical protein